MNYLIAIVSLLSLFSVMEYDRPRENSHSTDRGFSEVQGYTALALSPSNLEQRLVEIKDAELNAINAASTEIAKKTQLKKSKNVISLGDNDYQLIGIFRREGSSFVLIKGDNGVVRRLAKNDELAANIKLVNIETNAVWFDIEKTTKEFKLFRQENETNK